MVDKLQVDGEHGVDVGDVEVAEIGVGDVEAGLLPHHVEVAGELDTVLLVIDSKHVHDINPDVDDVDLAGEGKIELVIVPRQTQMLGEGDVGVAHHLLLGSVGP